MFLRLAVSVSSAFFCSSASFDDWKFSNGATLNFCNASSEDFVSNLSAGTVSFSVPFFRAMAGEKP